MRPMNQLVGASLSITHEEGWMVQYIASIAVFDFGTKYRTVLICDYLCNETEILHARALRTLYDSGFSSDNMVRVYNSLYITHTVATYVRHTKQVGEFLNKAETLRSGIGVRVLVVRTRRVRVPPPPFNQTGSTYPHPSAVSHTP